jgi:hypothetical protein
MSQHTEQATRPATAGVGTVERRRIEPVGFHWHGYERLTEQETAPTSADREARLSTAATVILAAPHAVSSWVAGHIYDPDRTGGRFTLWSPGENRWVVLHGPHRGRLVLEYLLTAARAESVYAAVDFPDGVRLEVFAEAVDRDGCTAHGLFSESLRDHYRSV